jgi:hypothetical protein
MKKIGFIASSLFLFVFSFVSCEKLSLKRKIVPPQITSSGVVGTRNQEVVISYEVTFDGGDSLVKHGICWSNSGIPDLTNQVVHAKTGAGKFELTVGGLTKNTLYNFRAFAINSVDTAFSQVLSATTTNLVGTIPSLITKGITNVSSSGCSTGGESISSGNSTITAKGVCWSTNPNPTISNLTTLEGSGNANFISQITGCNANVTYYVRSYATNAIGTGYGNQLTFTTSGTPPTVNTSNVSSISINSAVSGGNISLPQGGQPITERGVCWSTSSNPTIANSKTNNGTGPGVFTSQLSGLAPSTTYYVRAYATNASNTFYGNQVSFTTLNPPPVLVGTNSCNSFGGISSRYQGMNGTSAAWGLSTAGYSGNCFSAPDPSQEGQLGMAIGTHYLQFSRTFSKNGYIEFWSKASNPGAPGITPNIYVDGILQALPTVVGGQLSWSTFAKFRTSSISAGAHTIKIEYQCQYYNIYVDEIEFYE